MGSGVTTTSGLRAALLIALAATPAAAQTLITGAPVPRVEVSGGVSIGIGGPLFLDTGARVNLTRAVGVGVTLGWLGSGGTYVVDARWAPRGFSGRMPPFLTAGAVGTFRFESRAGFRQVIETTGDTLVYSPYHDLEISGLLSTVAGGGVRMPVARHTALEAIGQVWFGRFRPSPALVAGVRLTIAMGEVGR